MLPLIGNSILAEFSAEIRSAFIQVQFILSINSNTAFCCSLESKAHLSSSSVCPLVSETKLPSAKNWHRDIPNASHRLSRVDILGTLPRKNVADSRCS